MNRDELQRAILDGGAVRRVKDDKVFVISSIILSLDSNENAFNIVKFAKFKKSGLGRDRAMDVISFCKEFGMLPY